MDKKKSVRRSEIADFTGILRRIVGVPKEEVDAEEAKHKAMRERLRAKKKRKPEK